MRRWRVRRLGPEPFRATGAQAPMGGLDGDPLPTLYRVRYSLDPLCGHEIRGDVHRRFVAVRHGEEEEGIVPLGAWGDPRRLRRRGAWNMTR